MNIRDRKIKSEKARRSERGKVSSIFNHQKSACKNREMKMPEYSLSELRDWIFQQPNWKTLYDEWVNSKFKKALSPSIDRIDDTKSYYFGNIQLTTWAENDKRGHENIFNGVGRGGKRCKAVGQYDYDGNLIKIYHSFAAAGRETGFGYKVIWKCAAGILQRAYGFTWKYYSEDMQ